MALLDGLALRGVRRKAGRQVHIRQSDALLMKSSSFLAMLVPAAASFWSRMKARRRCSVACVYRRNSAYVSSKPRSSGRPKMNDEKSAASLRGVLPFWTVYAATLDRSSSRVVSRSAVDVGSCDVRNATSCRDGRGRADGSICTAAASPSPARPPASARTAPTTGSRACPAG